MGVSKNGGKTPKMDGENNGKPYDQMDDLGVPLFSETTICYPIASILFRDVRLEN